MSLVIQGGSAPTQVTVSATTATFGTTMTEGTQYVLCSTTAAWFAIGAAPTAVVRANGNHYIPPNFPYIIICQGPNTKVAIVQDAAGGFASLSQSSS